MSSFSPNTGLEYSISSLTIDSSQPSLKGQDNIPRLDMGKVVVSSSCGEKHYQDLGQKLGKNFKSLEKFKSWLANVDESLLLPLWAEIRQITVPEDKTKECDLWQPILDKVVTSSIAKLQLSQVAYDSNCHPIPSFDDGLYPDSLILEKLQTSPLASEFLLGSDPPKPEALQPHWRHVIILGQLQTDLSDLSRLHEGLGKLSENAKCVMRAGFGREVVYGFLTDLSSISFFCVSPSKFAGLSHHITKPIPFLANSDRPTEGFQCFVQLLKTDPSTLGFHTERPQFLIDSYGRDLELLGTSADSVVYKVGERVVKLRPASSEQAKAELKFFSTISPEFKKFLGGLADFHIHGFYQLAEFQFLGLPILQNYAHQKSFLKRCAADIVQELWQWCQFGWVHCDPRFENMVWDSKTQRARLVDFGLVIEHRALTSLVGNPIFAPTDFLHSGSDVHPYLCRHALETLGHSLALVMKESLCWIGVEIDDYVDKREEQEFGDKTLTSYFDKLKSLGKSEIEVPDIHELAAILKKTK